MHMVFKKRKTKWQQFVSVCVTVGIIAVLVVAAWLKREQLRRSMEAVENVSPWLLIGLLSLFLLTMSCAAASYYFLAIKPLRYRELIVIELAAAGVNRLVPSGVGSMGVHGVYLHHRGHNAAALAAVVGSNNILGITTHLLMLFVFSLMWPATLHKLALKIPANAGLIVVGLVAVMLIAYSLVPVREWLNRLFRDMGKHFALYRRKPHKLLLAICASAGITLVNVTIFALAAYAVGVRLDIITLFFVYSAGVLVGTATPTPGGLGGVEAGLIAGLMTFGVSSTTALAAALTFRLATFWWPLLIGTIAFAGARHKKLI